MPSLFNQVKNIMSGIKGNGAKDLLGDLGKQIDNLAAADVIDPNKKSSYLEIIRDTLYKSNNNDKVSVDDVVTDLSKQLEGAMVSQKRVKMYDEVLAIVRKMPILARAARVFVDNILSPDEITKIALKVVANVDFEDADDDDKYVNIIDEYNNILKSTGLEDIISEVIFDTLIEGERFIEIATMDSNFKNTVQSYGMTLKETDLVATVYADDKHKSNPIRVYEDVSFKSGDEINDGIEHILEANYRLVPSTKKKKKTTVPNIESKADEIIDKSKEVSEEEPQEEIDKRDSKTHDKIRSAIDDIVDNEDLVGDDDRGLDDSNLRSQVHDILNTADRLEDEDPEDDDTSGHYNKDYDTKASISPRHIRYIVHNPRNIVIVRNKKWVMGYLFIDKLNQYKDTNFNDEKPVNDILVDKLVKAVQIYLKDKSQADVPDDLKDTIANILQNNNNNDIVVRFIPLENMAHIKNPSIEFDPYGESYFYNLLPILRMYISRMVASTIYRLARAGKHMIIEVDVTNTNDARNRIEQIRRAMKKREVTGSDLSSIDTIFSHISTFEDIYIPAKDGKRTFNIDTLDMGGYQDRSDEDNSLLKNILTGIEIPPSLLGIEEYTPSRNTLSQESLIFARSIIRLQSVFTKQITDLFHKTYTLMHKSSHTVDPNYEDVIVTFPIPQGIMLSNKEQELQTAKNIIDMYADLGMPKDMAKKKFIPDIDWDKINTLQFNKNQNQNQDNGMGGDMGGLGGGDMGMGGDMGGFGGDMNSFEAPGGDLGSNGEFDDINALSGGEFDFNEPMSGGGDMNADLSSIGIS